MTSRQLNGQTAEAMAAQALASAGFSVSVPIFAAPAFDLVAKWGRAIHAIQVKSGALHDNQKSIQWMTHTPSGFYTEEDCSYFALVLIPRDEIWWVPVSEVAGKKSICTNAEKDVLHQYRGNLNPLREWGTKGDTILSAGGQSGGQSNLSNS